jgi:hypothetical protein
MVSRPPLVLQEALRASVSDEPLTPAQECRALGIDGTRAARCDCGEFRDTAAEKWVCPLCGERWFSIGYVIRGLRARDARRRQQRARGLMDIKRSL